MDHRYPDALHRLAASFELVNNPASVTCSVAPGSLYGARRTALAARLSIGHLRRTHGALDRTATLGFLMSDLPGWKAPKAVPFDAALAPFAHAGRRSRCRRERRRPARRRTRAGDGGKIVRMRAATPATPLLGEPAEGDTLDAAELDRLLEETSRTFALAIPLLAEPTRRQVTIAYLLFRIADTFEDADSWPRERRIQALADFAALLDHPAAGGGARGGRWLAASSRPASTPATCASWRPRPACSPPAGS